MNSTLLKRIFCILSILITLVAMGYNFHLMFYGHADLSHLCMTLAFVIAWVLLALVSQGSRKLLIYLLVYWAFAFVAAVLCLIIGISGGVSSIVTLANWLFLTPWVGLTFFGWGDAILLSIMMVIAAAFVVYSIVALRRAPKSEAGRRQSDSD